MHDANARSLEAEPDPLELPLAAGVLVAGVFERLATDGACEPPPQPATSTASATDPTPRTP